MRPLHEIRAQLPAHLRLRFVQRGNLVELSCATCDWYWIGAEREVTAELVLKVAADHTPCPHTKKED